MKIISIQVGKPRTVAFRGRQITTGIFKDKIAGPVLVRTTNIEGDEQADLRVHGGVNKAVYGYSLEAYTPWRQTRPQDRLEPGSFGENLSIDQLHEDQIFIGDQFRVGGAILMAVQPRFPCFKLGVKFGDLAAVKTFMQLNRPGVYFSVLQEGLIIAGDELVLIAREQQRISVQRVFSMFREDEISQDELAALLAIRALPPEMRAQFTRG